MCNDKTASEIVLLITVSGEADDGIRRAIEEALRVSNHIKRFKSIHIEFLAIPVDEDIYLRSGDIWTGKYLPRYGRKNGPNKQYFMTMKLCSQYNTTLLNETDMYPIKLDWLELSAKRIARMNHFLICGSLYKGELTLPEMYERHLNGNAFYATGHEGFKRGLLPAWERGLASLCSYMESAAYDIWLGHAYYSLLFGGEKDNHDSGYLREISRYYYLAVDASIIWNACMPGDSLNHRLVRALVEVGYLLVHGRGLIEGAIKTLETEAETMT